MRSQGLSLLILTLFLGFWLIPLTDPAVAEPLKEEGSVLEPESESPAKAKTMLKGGVEYLVPKGTPIKLKLASRPSNSMRLADRDLDGKLLPAKVGDEITAKTSEDIYVDDNKVIPEGTVFHGSVSKVIPPRRVYRPGWVEISFTRFVTPDGRQFAFRASADNFKPSTSKTKLKGFGIIAANTAGGAIVGALVAYQLFGLHNTIAMHGYNIAGGAAAGGLLATCYATMRHGPKATLEPGDDLNMEINSDLLVPAAIERSAGKKLTNLPGLKIGISSAKVIGDGLGGHILKITTKIDNESDQELNSIDAFVEDSNGDRHAVIAGPDEQSEFLFVVEPHSMKHLVLNFELEFPKLKRQLVWLDHESHQVYWRGELPQ